MDIDVATLFSSGLIGSNSCTKPCIAGLVPATKRLLTFKNAENDYEQLCRSYKNASSCVENKQKKCASPASTFDHSASLLFGLCNDNSRIAQERLPCVRNNIDNILQTCDSDCTFTWALGELSQRQELKEIAKKGGDRMQLYSEMYDLCPSAACFLSCLATKLNDQCGNIGSNMVYSMLRPLYTDAGIIEKKVDFKNQLLQYLPETCYPFILSEGLDAIRDGSFYEQVTGDNGEGLRVVRAAPEETEKQIVGEENKEKQPATSAEQPSDRWFKSLQRNTNDDVVNVEDKKIDEVSFIHRAAPSDEQPPSVEEQKQVPTSTTSVEEQLSERAFKSASGLIDVDDSKDDDANSLIVRSSRPERYEPTIEQPQPQSDKLVKLNEGIAHGDEAHEPIIGPISDEEPSDRQLIK